MKNFVCILAGLVLLSNIAATEEYSAINPVTGSDTESVSAGNYAIAAGEVLSLPARASGTLLYTAKVHIETADVFAITLVLIGLCFIVENIFAAAVKKISRSGRYD